MDNISELEKIVEAKKFIIKVFGELYANGSVAAITSGFYERARKAGLYNGGCDEPMNKALEELTDTVAAFKLKGI